MHVYVTGASSGIGEAIAREYARRGASLTLVARRRDRLEALAADLSGVRTWVVEHDLANVERVAEPVAEAEAELGPIDVLVNNAGVQIVGATSTTPWEEGEALLRVDTLAPLKLTLHVLPGMLARGAGTIVNMASMAAIAPTPGMFFYNAAKAALAAGSEGLRGELRGTGVHVVTVYPGPVRTAMDAAAREALMQSRVARMMSPTGDPQVLARLVADAVESKRPRVIYPRVYAISRHFPSTTRWLLDRLTPKPRIGV
ncbi:MAG TPA: SDR family NAD(P)-dependent oxidoreductase [Candidatus Limnocylindria bacterium]|nr:SDR family NAD(P)-dependent oxidoreductase [Candidatus Limnocylindria bacterium]